VFALLAAVVETDVATSALRCIQCLIGSMNQIVRTVIAANFSNADTHLDLQATIVLITGDHIAYSLGGRDGISKCGHRKQHREFFSAKS
jgi:hypothetical protein